jgi:hypothetical protein
MNKAVVFRILGLALLALLCTANVYAGNVTVVLDGNFPADYAFYTYTDVHGNVQSNIPISPYPATLNGANAYLACLDFFHHTIVGTPVSGHLITATTTADKEASYLMDFMVGKTPKSPISYIGPLALAIWEVEDASVPADPAAAAWVAAAQAAVAGGYQPDHLIFIPDDSSQQRFGVLTPEPSTLALLGSGILGLAGVLRRKYKAA